MGINFTADFKLKVMKEVLKEEQTINQIANKYQIVPKNIDNWRKIFDNAASTIFDKNDKSAIKYRKQLAEQAKEIDELHRQLGKANSELNWAKKKFAGLNSGGS